MKSENLFDAIGHISDEYVEESAPKNRKKKHSFRPLVALASAAAVLMVAILGSSLFGADNTFSIDAYAVETDKDGKIELHSFDLVDQPEIWSGYATDSTMFVNVGFRCKGENIKSVKFSAADGVFAKLRVDEKKVETIKKTTAFYIKKDEQIPLSSFDFEVAGSDMTVDGDLMTEDLLIFWGKDIYNIKNLPAKVDIDVNVTFKNGETEKKTVTLDLSGEGIYSLLDIDRERLFGVNNGETVIDESYIPQIEEAFISKLNEDGTLESVKVNQIKHDENTLWQNVWRVEFDILPCDGKEDEWIAGNGRLEDSGWIRDKSLFIELSLKDGKIEVEIIGTGL